MALFLPVAAFADSNPFVGRWTVQVVGATKELIFQFTEEGDLYVLAEGEETEAQPYMLYPAEGRIEFTTPETGSMSCLYSWEGVDVFVLFITGELLDQMTQSAAFAAPEGSNEVTVAMMDRLREAMHTVFAETPFIKGVRLD